MSAVRLSRACVVRISFACASYLATPILYKPQSGFVVWGTEMSTRSPRFRTRQVGSPCITMHRHAPPCTTTHHHMHNYASPRTTTHRHAPPRTTTTSSEPPHKPPLINRHLPAIVTSHQSPSLAEHGDASFKRRSSVDASPDRPKRSSLDLSLFFSQKDSSYHGGKKPEENVRMITDHAFFGDDAMLDPGAITNFTACARSRL